MRLQLTDGFVITITWDPNIPYESIIVTIKIGWYFVTYRVLTLRCCCPVLYGRGRRGERPHRMRDMVRGGGRGVVVGVEVS